MSRQEHLFPPRPPVHRDDPQSGHDAVAQLSDRKREVGGVVFFAGALGITGRDAAAVMNVPQNWISGRLRELADTGLITQTAELRVPDADGPVRRQVVWVHRDNLEARMRLGCRCDVPTLPVGMTHPKCVRYVQKYSRTNQCLCGHGSDCEVHGEGYVANRET